MADFDAVLEEFRTTSEGSRLEELADELRGFGRHEAVPVLLYRLGDAHVQEDRDVEDAVCDALVALNVMRRLGNLNFRFLESDQLGPDVQQMIREYEILLPRKYFRDRPANGD